MKSVKTALVVDDDPSARLLLEKFLTRSGFEVQTAKHGGEAVAKLAETDFTVVMLDLMMPVLDGIGVLEFLRRRRPGQIARVIIITAYPGQVSTEALGVRAIVSKPFTQTLIREILSRF